MVDAGHHHDPNPVRPSQAEGDPDEDVDEATTEPTIGSDPKTNRPSQAEGEADDD